MYQGCAEVDGTAAPDAVSLGVVLKYFKSASEERREVYVTTACYILIKKQMLGVLYMRLIQTNENVMRFIQLYCHCNAIQSNHSAKNSKVQ